MDPTINSLADLQKLRSAPNLDSKIKRILLKELLKLMKDADWFTVGIMAPTADIALNALKEMERKFNWLPMRIKNQVKEQTEPVFLKANQNTGDIYLRIEYNLGEGILLTCQKYDEKKGAETIGPLPLDFFKAER